MAEKHASRSRSPILLGVGGVFCAVLGLLAWLEYGAFAMRAIHAVISHDSGAAQWAAIYADGFRFIQMLLGIAAMLLGWTSLSRGPKARIARWLGYTALWAGVAVLMLSFLLV
jgi:hypothetical protein